MLTQEEIKNLVTLIALAPIKGSDAMTVALLQQKLAKMLAPEPKKDDKEGKEGKDKKATDNN